MINKLRSTIALKANQEALPIYFYDNVATRFIDIHGKAQQALYVTLADFLENTECYHKSIKVEGERVSFHFIRNIPHNDHLVIVIQDDQSNINLNKSFSLITGVLAEVLSERDEHEALTNILRISRDKLLKLVDGMFRPLYSINSNREIVSINKATTVCCGHTDFTKIINKPCYSEIFQKETICEWCMVDEVIENKTPVSQNIKVEMMGERRVFSMTTFPILSEDGDIIEIGESLDDITREHNLIDEIKEHKLKVRKFSKDKISKIKEIEGIKTEYRKLLEGYTVSQENVRRLSEALRKLIKDSSAMQILSLRKENKYLETKVNQQKNQIHNLGSQMNKHVTSQADLSRKSVYGIERMCNIMINKSDFTSSDFADSIEFIIQQIEIIKETQGDAINEALKASLADLASDIDGYTRFEAEDVNEKPESSEKMESLVVNSDESAEKGAEDKAPEEIKADTETSSGDVSTEEKETMDSEPETVGEDPEGERDRATVAIDNTEMKEIRPNDQIEEKQTIVKRIKDKYKSITE